MMMMLETTATLWPTLAISLSIIGSALGIILTIWKVILSTVNGHLKEFGRELMARIDANAERTSKLGDDSNRAIIGALVSDGMQTRQTLRDLLPAWTRRS